MTTIDSRRGYNSPSLSHSATNTPAGRSAPRSASAASTTGSSATGHSAAGSSATDGAAAGPYRDLSSWDRSEWVAHALCRNDGGDSLFVKGAAQRDAALRCLNCPVLIQCRADALDSRVEFGVWGGMTERERRSILRHFPDVPSWRNLLDPVTRGATLAEGEGDPEGALEALKALNVNTERRFKRHKSSKMQQFTRVLNDIADQLDTSSEEESSEMETLKTIETLRHFKEQSSSE